MEQKLKASLSLFLVSFLISGKAFSQDFNGNPYQYQMALPNYQGNSLGASNFVSNYGNYQGYNYQTPAGTYAPTISGSHKSQTPPLALSLHGDDYQNFDKSPETYFVPQQNLGKQIGIIRPELRAAQEFYIERSKLKANSIQNQIGSQTLQEYQPSNGGTLTPSTENKYPQSSFNEQETGKWSPLPSNKDLLSKQFPSNDHRNKEDSVNYFLNNGDGQFLRDFKVNQFRKEQTLNSEPIQIPSIASIPTSDCEAQNQSEVGADGNQVLKSGQLGEENSSLNINKKIEASSPSIPSFNLANSPKYFESNSSNQLNLEISPAFLHQQRLQLLRSLIAEYLSLAYPQAVNGLTQRPFDSENQFKDPSSISPPLKFEASSLESNDGGQNLPAERSLPPQPSQQTASAIRQPHPVYGAPLFGNRISRVLRRDQEAS